MKDMPNTVFAFRFSVFGKSKYSISYRISGDLKARMAIFHIIEKTGGDEK
jgi:hypothetical protein